MDFADKSAVVVVTLDQTLDWVERLEDYSMVGLLVVVDLDYRIFDSDRLDGHRHCTHSTVD